MDYNSKEFQQKVYKILPGNISIQLNGAEVWLVLNRFQEDDNMVLASRNVMEKTPRWVIRNTSEENRNKIKYLLNKIDKIVARDKTDQLIAEALKTVELPEVYTQQNKLKSEVMDIYSRPGTKVKFIGRNGHDYQLAKAKEIFTEGQILTIKQIDVSNWSSSVQFEEVGGWFNTVMFGRVAGDDI